MSQFETKLMTPEEHTGVYKTIAETIVQEDLDLDERVERGALHLDEHFPGWAEKMNLEKFEIADSSQCVIGQMCGYYHDRGINRVAKMYGDEEFDETNYSKRGEVEDKLDTFAERHGFVTREDDWLSLQVSWEKAIKARQSA